MGEQVAARFIKKILDLPVIRKLNRFSFLMTDKTVNIKKIDANLRNYVPSVMALHANA